MNRKTARCPTRLIPSERTPLHLLTVQGRGTVNGGGRTSKAQRVGYDLVPSASATAPAVQVRFGVLGSRLRSRYFGVATNKRAPTNCKHVANQQLAQRMAKTSGD